MNIDHSFNQVQDIITLLNLSLNNQIEVVQACQDVGLQNMETSASIHHDPFIFSGLQEQLLNISNLYSFEMFLLAEEQRLDYSKFVLEMAHSKLQHKEESKPIQNKQQLKQQFKYYQLLVQPFSIALGGMHMTPRTIFNYQGVDIEVRFQRFLDYQGSCLVLPYKNFTYQQIKKTAKNDPALISAISRHFGEKAEESKKESQILRYMYCSQKSKAEKINYPLIQLAQQPMYKHDKISSLQKLKIMINGIIQICVKKPFIRTIVFYDFEWVGLEKDQMVQSFFDELLKALREHKERDSLQAIIICCENPLIFPLYMNELRNISDQYFQCGLINSDQARTKYANKRKQNTIKYKYKKYYN